MLCYCKSGRSFESCCQPLVQPALSSESNSPAQIAQSAEQLMRSRFTAYVLKNYTYVLKTYSASKQQDLTVTQLAESAEGVEWLNLDVVSSSSHNVEFKAWYKEDNKFGLLHETSTFVFEDNSWRYHDGVIHDDTGIVKPGRNDGCLCGSGKKYKQCCMRG